MFNLLNLKPNELVAFVTGLLGLVFALIGHRRANIADGRAERAEKRAETAEERAVRAEARALEAERATTALAYAHKKSELLASIVSGEAAHLAAKVVAQDLRDEAEDTGVAEAAFIVEQANVLIEASESSISLLEESRAALQQADAKAMTHIQLLHLVETHADAVRGVADKNKIEASAAALLQPSRRMLKVIQRALSSRTPG